MDITTSLLLTGALCLFAGLIMGMLLGRTLHPKEQQRKSTEGQLKSTQDELKDYQHEITEHFAKTAKLFNELSHSYQAVHDHLSSSAMRLANTDISRKMSEAGLAQLKEAKVSLNELPEAPKDYAPKVPGGILSEEYGLREESSATHGQRIKVANDLSKNISDEEDPTLKVG